MRISLSCISVAITLHGVHAAIYTDPSQLPDKQYDYVVVGGAYYSLRLLRMLYLDLTL